ncbi:MAG: copper resistance protein CopC, partial [Microcella sp.]|uniref:copper resistance CopC family protein n=1 Tax=Microcella sp. TaxID=1913979 RepID=UPI002720849D
RAARAGAATTAAAAALVLGLASPAAAHDYVVDSTPSDGATITALPEAWTVTANNPLLTLEGNDGAFAIVVTDAEGLYYGDGCVEVSGATMTAPAVLGEPGAYEMTFQYVSSDGHTLSETYGFTYAPADDEAVTEGSTAAPECGGDPAAGAGANDDASGGGAATDETAAVLAGVAWIGGGLLAAAAVATVVVLANRRRPAGD